MKQRLWTSVIAGAALLLGLAITNAAGWWPRRRAPSETAARVGDVVVTTGRLADLARGSLARLRAEEYEIRRRVLDQEIGRLLIEREAATRKVTPRELVRQEVDARAVAVTDQEVHSIYRQNRDRFARVSEQDAVAEIREALERQRKEERRAEFVRELRRHAEVGIFLEAPRTPVSASGPSRGPAGAPVTIVEFSDFECPYCARVGPTLAKIHARYGDKVRVVFRDFPLPFHRRATKASEAAACADAQGRFWPMHDKLFANQEALALTDLKRYARELGLDPRSFDRCLDSGEKAEVWRGARAEGAEHGVTGTPTLFVNGRRMSGAPSYEQLAEIVDEELDRAARAKLVAALGW